MFAGEVAGDRVEFAFLAAQLDNRDILVLKRQSIETGCATVLDADDDAAGNVVRWYDATRKYARFCSMADVSGAYDAFYRVESGHFVSRCRV